MLELIIQGSFMMIPLLVLSVLALAVVCDRFVAFRANKLVDVRTLRAKVLAMLRDGQEEEALALCFNTIGPVSAVMAAGLQSYMKHKDIAGRVDSLRAVVQDAMEDYSHQAVLSVNTRLNVLAFVGSSAPLFGMTGTVTGMISSFDAIASAASMDPTLVASGISEALITTAAGLMIAMGAVIPYHYFSTRAESIETEIVESASELLDYITIKHSSLKAK
ncbi:MAG: MotA/TolQ/ExbB proton channel family protein [Lentisphaeria bacterium]|nr:MotA/TolQ/ExbB proton channel family protein [Lentisphaeria bacterium]NQZ69819.1 MotA/TolQ/ExbB proton channel family protein [Lentisphaeria bacterium]